MEGARPWRLNVFIILFLKKENRMKKGLMIGLPALCGTFAAFGQYMKRRFSSLEICLLHIIVALTIPTLFIGCGPPVGALFDDTSKVQLPEVIEDTKDSILRQVIGINYDVDGDGHIRSDYDDIEGLYTDFYDLYYRLIHDHPPGTMFKFYFGGMSQYSSPFEGNLERLMAYLRVNWNNFYTMYQNERQVFILEIP
jgi:hypothetical protein